MKKATVSVDADAADRIIAAARPRSLSDVQVARLLGKHPASVRRWRVLNKAAGYLKYGPPYEYHGSNVVYPCDKFDEWIHHVDTTGGIPRMNLPEGSPLARRLYRAAPAGVAD